MMTTVHLGRIIIFYRIQQRIWEYVEELVERNILVSDVVPHMSSILIDSTPLQDNTGHHTLDQSKTAKITEFGNRTQDLDGVNVTF
jgi:hypothetical protein